MLATHELNHPVSRISRSSSGHTKQQQPNSSHQHSTTWNSWNSWKTSLPLAPSSATGSNATRFVVFLSCRPRPRRLALNLNGLPTPSPNHSCRCCSVDHQTNHNTFAEPRSLTGGSELQPQVRPAKTLPDTHQRETLCVQHTWMRQELHPKKRPDCAYSHPHRREASPVPAHRMRKEVLRCKRRRERLREAFAPGHRDTDLSHSRPRWQGTGASIPGSAHINAPTMAASRGMRSVCSQRSTHTPTPLLSPLRRRWH